MHVTDIFIRRPVLALVVNALILALGLRAMSVLPILQYPHMPNGVVTVTTTYPGADSNVIAGFVTAPLEDAIAEADGIDYMSSSSRTGISVITVNLRLGYDAAKALAEIDAKVSTVLDQLPKGTQQPALVLKAGPPLDALYMAFTSDVLGLNEVTDYVTRVVQPRLQAISGVQAAEILGGRTFALRAWLDPARLAAHGLTANEVATALKDNDTVVGIGTTQGHLVQVQLSAATNLHSVEEFRNLAIKKVSGVIVRLKDVANVTLGSTDDEARASFNGKPAVLVGIQADPSASLPVVMRAVRTVLAKTLADLPAGLTGTVLYDVTDFVGGAITAMIHALFAAAAIAVVVVAVFLGAWRAAAIPFVALALAIIGSFAPMLAFGFSINLLTLLALVLAVGLVADDAVLVAERIDRHIASGLKPPDAAIIAARELARPIVASTMMLMAIYAPIGLRGGLTGILFMEFAFTLVAAVVISAIIALTLSPLICARLLKPRDAAAQGRGAGLARAMDGAMKAVTAGYARALSAWLRRMPLAILLGILALGSAAWFHAHATRELAPGEDQGVVLTVMSAAPNATPEQREFYIRRLHDILAAQPETELAFQMNMPGEALGGWVLKPYGERTQSALSLAPRVQEEFDRITGARVAAFRLPPLPGSSGLPIQFVLTADEPHERLYQVARNVMTEALASGAFIFLDIDLKFDQPHATLHFDRDRVASLGLTMSEVGAAIESMLGGGYVNYFDLHGKSYMVIVQVMRRKRLNVDQILDYYIRAEDGTMVPLSTIARIAQKTVPQSLNRFQRLNSATISGVPMPGVSEGEALARLKRSAERALPAGYGFDLAGASRQLQQEADGFVVTFELALAIIFLTQAALFNSFRDPLVILASVPMALAGALMFIWLGIGGATLNIYTQVGLLALMGLLSKHGILMVGVANDLRLRGWAKRAAIIEAASLRLRPILITTTAMVLACVPLLIATEAGANARHNIGLIMASGLTIGMLCTLFMVPALYLLISRKAEAGAGEAGASSDLIAMPSDRRVL